MAKKRIITLKVQQTFALDALKHFTSRKLKFSILAQVQFVISPLTFHQQKSVRKYKYSYIKFPQNFHSNTPLTVEISFATNINMIELILNKLDRANPDRFLQVSIFEKLE